MAPMVSAAIGMNEYDCVNEAYLVIFLFAAASAAAPGVYHYYYYYCEPYIYR